MTVTAYDAFGNVATAYTGTVVADQQRPQAVVPPYYTFTAADAGQHTLLGHARYCRHSIDHGDRRGDVEPHGH